VSGKIPDQRPIWDRKHGEGQHESIRTEPSTLAQLVEPKLPAQSKVLDLGCGVGRDVVFFAGKGHNVLATDFSEVVIRQNREQFADSGVKFEVLDMTRPLAFPDGSFDAVHANLSIHYFDHATTKKVVQEIARVLKPSGIFAFSCKSTNDFHYGNGEEVEKDVFVSKTGHVRHLFSIPYTYQLLESLFEIDSLKEIEEEYTGQKSMMIQCIARKSVRNRSK
jgi:SAM-dependent methyltransferase